MGIIQFEDLTCNEEELQMIGDQVTLNYAYGKLYDALEEKLLAECDLNDILSRLSDEELSEEETVELFLAFNEVMDELQFYIDPNLKYEEAFTDNAEKLAAESMGEYMDCICWDPD